MPRPQEKASIELIRRARALTACTDGLHCAIQPEIQIDYTAMCLPAPDDRGSWVQAWVWVPDEPETKPLDAWQIIVLRWMDSIKAGAICLPRAGFHGVWVWREDIIRDPAISLEISKLPACSLTLAEALAD